MKQTIIIFLILLAFGTALWYFLSLQRNRANLGCKKYGNNYEAVLISQSGYQCREILRP